ncbi:class I adenylate-forming enzyme family protein [Nocardia sp. NPDC055321]
MSTQMTSSDEDATADSAIGFAAALAAKLTEYGDRPCLEFEQRWYSGDELLQRMRALTRTLAEAGVGPAERVGLVVRNRVPHAAAILGSIAAGRPLAMINSYQSAGSIARDIEELRLSAVIAEGSDWTGPVVAACSRAGSAGISLSPTASRTEVRVPRAGGGTPPPDPASDLPGLHILTSGTTGPPKRVAIPMAALAHTVHSMTGGLPATPEDPPELVYWPFGSIGICQLLAGPFLGKRMVLLEKFGVEAWVRAVKSYGIKRTGVQPAILRMLLDADVPPADLASLEYLPGGSGPLEPELRAEFEGRYGIPLLWGYGATEFAGSVCAWTPDLHRRFGADKPGSVGKPLPGVQVRVVDPDTGAEVEVGTRGFLEARVAVLGPGWGRTTDLASIDADGFITIHGRGDGAINRGGFKILPETVRHALLAHPAILDACVVGVPEPLLGEVPFAAVELRRGAVVPAESELLALVRESLPSHHIPVAITIVGALPRNAAWKVRVAEVKSLYERAAPR